MYSPNKQRGKKARGGYPFTDAGPLELITEWRDYSNGLSQRRLGWFFQENSFFSVRASSKSLIPFDDDDDNCVLKLASRITIEEQLSVADTVKAQIFTDAGPLELITEWRDYSNGLSQRRLGWFFHENSFFSVRASNESVIPFDDDKGNCALKLASRVTIEEQLSVADTVKAQIFGQAAKA